MVKRIKTQSPQFIQPEQQEQPEDLSEDSTEAPNIEQEPATLASACAPAPLEAAPTEIPVEAPIVAAQELPEPEPPAPLTATVEEVVDERPLADRVFEYVSKQPPGYIGPEVVAKALGVRTMDVLQAWDKLYDYSRVAYLTTISPPAPVLCEKCGAALQSTARECHRCGTKIKVNP